MNGIKRFFGRINNFLNAAEEYFDNRIRTGKFTADISFLFSHGIQEIGELLQRSFLTIRKSTQYKAFSTYFMTVWKSLLKINFFAFLTAIIFDAIKLFVRYYTEIFIVFAMTFPTAILLLNFFENSIVLFFIVLLPILLYNNYCLAALYDCITRRESGLHVSLWRSFHRLLSHIQRYTYVFLLQCSLILITTIVYFILTLFTSYLFDLFGIAWSNTFIYWFLTIFFGMIVLIGLFLLTLIMHQTYFFVLLDDLPIHSAMKDAWIQVKKHSGSFFFLYLLVYVFFGLLVWRSALSYLHLGITISSFFFIQVSLLLGFVLRRHMKVDPMKPELMNSEPTYAIAQAKKPHIPLFTIIIVLGFINYILASILVAKNYDTINAFIQQQQQKVLLSQEQSRYTNATYRYTIEYPQSWGEYEWSNNAVTFYHNSTGTISGGVWLRISVSQYAQTSFMKLYNFRPGIVSMNKQTHDVTTKVSNISVQGNAGVVYTQTVDGQPYSEYQTHYLVHKGDYTYDIMFTTLANDVAIYNSDLFEKIISTFRFIE